MMNEKQEISNIGDYKIVEKKNKYPYEYISEIEKQLLEDQLIVNKYHKAGIYCIKINGILVYIGKSRDMLNRIANHIFYCKNLKWTKSHKYQIFNLAQIMGYDISFDVLYIASSTGNINDEIGNKEGELIRQYLPPLNYQIPKEEDYHKYTINKKASTITLMDILGECDKENQLNY